MADPSAPRAALPPAPDRTPGQTPGQTPGRTLAAPGPADAPADGPANGPASPDPADPFADLSRQIGALRAEVARLNGHRFVRDLNSPVRMLAFQFARGLALGLGTVVGASILVSLSVYLLSQVDFIPILGDWAAEIAREIEAGR